MAIGLKYFRKDPSVKEGMENSSEGVKYRLIATVKIGRNTVRNVVPGTPPNSNLVVLGFNGGVSFEDDGCAIILVP